MITDKNFRDWESNTFGFGYGTGEQYTLPALKEFFNLCNDGPSCMYNYEVLEGRLTPTVAWLLINILVSSKVGVVEYGTSPRYAWLTDKGMLIKEYVDSKTSDELYDVVMAEIECYERCSPSFCNCTPKKKPKECNPLF